MRVTGTQRMSEWYRAIRFMQGGIVWVGVALASCTMNETSERVPDFELETEWFVVRGYDRDVNELCGGSLTWLDSYVGALAKEFDIAPTTIGAYHWYSQESWDEFGICGDATGCAAINDGVYTAFSRDFPHEHEVVHVVLNNLYEPCVAVLSEGLAEYMRGPGRAAGGSIENSSIEDVLAVSFDGEGMGESDYHRARHFVSFLVFEFGLDDVLALCAETPKGSTRVEFSDACSATLGSSLDELLVSYASYPVCGNYEDRAKLWECSREPVVQLGPGDEHVFDFDASCVNPDAVGPRSERYHVSYQVRILADGEYSWAFNAQAPTFDLTGAELRLEQCASCGEGALGFSDDWSGEFIPLPRWLAAGDYTLEIILPLEFSGAVNVQFAG
jgi:hypothetical protein